MTDQGPGTTTSTLPATDRLFQRSLAGWYAEWKATARELTPPADALVTPDVGAQRA